MIFELQRGAYTFIPLPHLILMMIGPFIRNYIEPVIDRSKVFQGSLIGIPSGHRGDMLAQRLVSQLYRRELGTLVEVCVRDVFRVVCREGGHNK
jgi:hypothetical protein